MGFRGAGGLNPGRLGRGTRTFGGGGGEGGGGGGAGATTGGAGAGGISGVFSFTGGCARSRAACRSVCSSRPSSIRDA